VAVVAASAASVVVDAALAPVQVPAQARLPLPVVLRAVALPAPPDLVVAVDLVAVLVAPVVRARVRRASVVQVPAQVLVPAPVVRVVPVLVHPAVVPVVLPLPRSRRSS
jgi:hypothetical protein